MATEDQYLQAGHGIGSRSVTSNAVTLTVAGATTVAGTIVVPDGAWLDAVKIDTPVVIAGSPTSCLVRVGTTLHGQQIVADVDAKAAGKITATLVAAFDTLAGLVGNPTLFIEVTTIGSSGAGPIGVRATYSPPAR